ncbi:DUF559 domain-containing protein [Micromonospora noduli]|uniref:endonuclease domain-containing protein n=1 Tax=Micromonospora noduli TaxID=709876 RepID=UPI00343A19A0
MPAHRAPRRRGPWWTPRAGRSAWTRRSRFWPPVASNAGCCPRSCRRCSASSLEPPRRRLIGQTISDIAGGAQALSEIDFLRLCRRHRLPAPDLQEHRVDAAGRNRWLDAYWREWRVQVEIDGAHHMDVKQWAADMRRQNDVWNSGDRILRFPAWLVRARPDEVADTVRRALIAAGWTPAPPLRHPTQK